MLGVGEHGGCHGGSATADGLDKIVIVGNPNVGKSVVFNYLTGAYATVSNYPGTTVAVFRGRATVGNRQIELIDTPGMYSLRPITDEELVARSILLDESPQAVLHVADAKNLERMLPFTLELLEAGLPVILDLNMMDEAEEMGLKTDLKRLELELGIPVVATVGTSGRGMEQLRRKLGEYVADHRRCA
ncbi:MAG: 50S ribosome-binding GTPase [Chloroflexi bacterium]|nr:50S ribosome-binding GTPase [Chloroflexota bacterium]